MSEYQFYEFQTVDHRLTAEEMDYVRSLSSRVEPTATQAVFVYNYGSFRAQPGQVLEKCFDAMLYMANWGSKRLMFRFPKAAIDITAVENYCITDEIELTQTKDYVILDLNFGEDEPADEWYEGEGILSGLIDVRDEILRGDFRSLYLAWLKSVQNESDEYDSEDEETDEDEVREPPVPPNLKNLSRALKNLVNFLDIDPDFISAAIQASPTSFASADPIERWIHDLPDSEKIAFLVQIANGEPGVGPLLVRRLRELYGAKQPAVSALSDNRRTVSMLFEAVSVEREQRAAEQKQAAERQKATRMAALAPQESALWEKIGILLARKQVKAYDEAVIYLKELRELSQYNNKLATFEVKIREIQQMYPTLSGLHSRIHKAGLIKY
jgi:hypothetical protein